MKRVELLLPAGNEDCLRAAANNGADAVYLGLSNFSARQFAQNFANKKLFSAVEYCHKRKVKVYAALNTLVKNSELDSYFELVNIAHCAGVDAIIVQDPCLVPIIKDNFPGLKIHLSTQATAVNTSSVPSGVDRVILPRELSLGEISEFSKKYETEMFVHGALCLSYSGQCLLSSFAGGRSGNRGQCAQPCRMRYNGKYLLSTMDLCLLEKIPELIETGVSGFKVEGRMRSPAYVATVVRIYRKAVDSYYAGKFKVDKQDIADLKLVFNREFTTGFAFNDSIVDSRNPMNRGLYLGSFKGGLLRLEETLKVGDGLGVWAKDTVSGLVVKTITKSGKSVPEAYKGDSVKIGTDTEEEGVEVYKTSSAGLRVNLGDPLGSIEPKIKEKTIQFSFDDKKPEGEYKIFVRAHNLKSVLEADAEKADVIYYDVLRPDWEKARGLVKNSRLFAATPRILSDSQLAEVVKRIKDVNPDGIFVGNRGLIDSLKNYELHLDYSLNCFNDIDLNCYPGTPIMSPELSFEETAALHDKRFIVFVHGDIIVMTTKQKIGVSEFADDEGRTFRVRERNGLYEVLNGKQLGLFNSAKDYLDCGIRKFYIDSARDVGKLVNIYRKILGGEQFNDGRVSRGCTTGHFNRGVI